MATTTGFANQLPNTLCIRLWIDVMFRGLEYCFKIENIEALQSLRLESS